MLVLVINSGSSSLKYQVRDVEAGSVLAEGLVDSLRNGDQELPSVLVDYVASDAFSLKLSPSEP